MQPSANYPLFASICALGIIAWFACLEAWRAHKRASEADGNAYRAHSRLDRMQKTAKLTDRETMSVSYSQGFQLRDSWEDDFHRTQLIRQKLKLSWFQRFKLWLKY